MSLCEVLCLCVSSDHTSKKNDTIYSQPPNPHPPNPPPAPAPTKFSSSGSADQRPDTQFTPCHKKYVSELGFSGARRERRRLQWAPLTGGTETPESEAVLRCWHLTVSFPQAACRPRLLITSAACCECVSCCATCRKMPQAQTHARHGAGKISPG